MAVKDLVKGICSTNKCNFDVYTKEKSDELLLTKANKGDFAILTGIVPEYGDNVELNYPEGFNKDNCVVIASSYDFTKNGFYKTGALLANIFTDTTIAESVTLNNNSVTFSLVNLNNNEPVEIVNVPFKIVLMKIS